MPIMKSKFERCGEPIPMRVDKRDYLFMENHDGDFVAKIDSEDHVNYLLATGNFELYEPKSASTRGKYAGAVMPKTSTKEKETAT